MTTIIGIVLVLAVGSAVAANRDPGGAAVASAHPLATQAGREIIDGGGNAFDAAIAVAAALAVVEPYSSGIGGGGFFLLHAAVSGADIFLDARERAPIAATKDMYLDTQGEVIQGKSLNGALAAGIPGTPAALVHLALNYGRLPLEKSLAPAIKIARGGFSITEHYREMAGFRKDSLAKDAASADIFLDGGEVPAGGFVLKQRDLAATLERLTTQGTAGFYGGEIADRLVDGVRAGGGIWSAEDLAQYRVVEREPIVGRYRDMQIISAPPPSSGGIVLIEALNILEAYDLAALSAGDRRHLTIEAMRRAYRDRAEYLGDPDVYDVPVAALIDKAHAKEISADISLKQATPSSALKPIAPPAQGDHTTHFSILDIEGNRVAATLSVNYPFGACFTPPRTGVLLNNEMDDFSSRPLTPNAYGLVGVDANAIGPGKRPLSSMAPSFLLTEDRIGILGTPGGSRIISMVLLSALEFYAGSKPEAWVTLPRYHHQYLPDEVLYESAAFDATAQGDLKTRGHTLKLSNRDYGNMHAILWDLATNEVTAASDPRGEGAAMVWAARLPVVKPKGGKSKTRPAKAPSATADPLATP
ncbi:MAG: gamma-glutamyltransferase, partial [Gammaproteobacteria bacterium]